MSKVFILMVMTQVQAGNVMAFQEFSSQERCEYAKSLFIRDHFVLLATCVPR